MCADARKGCFVSMMEMELGWRIDAGFLMAGRIRRRRSLCVVSKG